MNGLVAAFKCQLCFTCSPHLIIICYEQIKASNLILHSLNIVGIRSVISNLNDFRVSISKRVPIFHGDLFIKKQKTLPGLGIESQQ